MNSFPKPTMLMILDGFGINENTRGNAIAAADTPNLDKIFASYPHTQLDASGLAVGLPAGQMGNSEVGHLNIGAGRIVYQELTKITKKIADGTFFKNEVLLAAMKNASESSSKSLHLLGLLSDGGVHSHIEHLLALIKMAKTEGVERLYVHCFLDGRDVPPCCAEKYISELSSYMNEIGLGQIATVSGRYYAMDRDKRWERVSLAYDAITRCIGEYAATALDAVSNAYLRGENDEFVQPTIIDGDFCGINDGDSVIMYNFRPDRAREITRALTADNFDGFTRVKRPSNLFYVCMTQYEAEMPNVKIAFPPENLTNTLGEYVAKLGLTQLRIAETEKYAHVTFFFNGGVEAPNRNEDRVLIPSPKVATYDLKPEMSAYEVTDAVIEKINEDKYDLIILNFANADMVGHTGIMAAAVSAVEALDNCVKRIADIILKHGGQILLTADHGNADKMLDDNGNVVTSHSTNPVPLVHIAENPSALADGGCLCDIAPTLLTLMGLDLPAEMTGKNLAVK
ncbi:MAG: 2,3-bisphosphoglycerate-independent phosphoglycerate mutase [Eubacteriales Family XIII. Incertae Sedis bacterium]|nr:MAG: 2,3-bisphosphoglycerate-independent phosphoglycerate mutase [Clostridiales Family XIII bacterium]